MSQITFRVDYAESFRRGVSCKLPPVATLDVDPGQLAPESRELLASRLSNEGVVLSRNENGSFSHSTPVLANAPTVEALIAAIQAEEAAIAEVANKKAAESAARLDRARAWAAKAAFIQTDSPREYTSRFPGFAIDYGDFHESHHDDVKELPEVKAIFAKVEAMNRAAYTAHLTKKEEAKKKEQQEQSQWIVAHGSARLKKLLAEGIGHDEVYAQEFSKWSTTRFDEALAESRPGWSKIDVADYSLYAPDNAPMKYLRWLDAARKVAPDAKLNRLYNQQNGDFIIIAEFQGRKITWPPRD